jgi:hypothetical protein
MHIILVIVLLYIAFHAGHGHANYRHGKSRKVNRVRLYWSTVMGPYASIRIGGFRIGHKL